MSAGGLLSRKLRPLGECAVRSVRHILFFPRGLFASPTSYYQSVEILLPEECRRVVSTHFELGTGIYSGVVVVVAVLSCFFPPPPEADCWGLLGMAFIMTIFAGYLLSVFLFYSMAAVVWLALRRSCRGAQDLWRVAFTAVAQTTVVNRIYFIVPLYLLLQLVMLGYAIRGARVVSHRAPQEGIVESC